MNLYAIDRLPNPKNLLDQIKTDKIDLAQVMVGCCFPFDIET